MMRSIHGRAGVVRLLLLAALLGLAGPAAASWSASYFIFDRAVWSPDGRQVGVIGEYFDVKTHQSFEDTLLIDVASGAITCVSPSALRFCLSRDGRRMLFMGRWGLYDHDIAAGVTRLLYYQHPFQPIQIVNFAYTRDLTAALAIRCSDWEPEISGVYRLPLDGAPPERAFTDSECGTAGFNYFQTNRRRMDAPLPVYPTTQRPLSPEHFPGSIWRIDREGLTGLAVWGNGAAGSDTLCLDCRAEFISWHPRGSSVLVATAPEDAHDIVTPRGIYLLQPSREPIHLADSRIFSAIWPDTSFAFALYGDGSVGVVDAIDRTFRPVSLSMTPDWLRRARLGKAELWTVRCDGSNYPSPDSARSVVLARSGPGGAWAIDPVEGGGGFRLSVGAFADSASALREARTLEKERFPAAATAWRVERRPVSRLLGSFEFGSVPSPDGQSRLVFRSHPNLFQPFIGTEVLVEPKGGRRRILVEGMSSF